VKQPDASLPEGLSTTQLASLRAYHQLLVSRGIPLGLVSARDRDRLWERHIVDSLRAAPCLTPGRVRRVADLGSGGGLPGLPIAIVHRDLEVHVVESMSRRVAFLELAIPRLGLTNVVIVHARVEDFHRDVDGCLARALAAPEKVWRMAAHLLGRDGFVLYWAGRSWARGDQTDLAAAGLRTEVCAEPSEVWQGPVVKISRMVRTPDPDTP
jgi:16S rRNA (guanine527-N7)-methyltransferase